MHSGLSQNTLVCVLTPFESLILFIISRIENSNGDRERTENKQSVPILKKISIQTGVV
jgi:hypothetical protein